MAGTKSRRPTSKIIERWIKQGFGQGEGKTYKPLMYVRDVPSEGTSSMVYSHVTGRTHHYLSRLEFYVHLLAEHCRQILDIREQYALLPWDETQAVASKLGIKHPVVPSTPTPTVLTTDLLLSLERTDGTETIAVSVKPSNELDARAYEKLLLERLYWNRRGVTWVLASAENIPMTRAVNLAFFENALRNDADMRNETKVSEFSKRFEANWTPDRLYIEILRRACADFAVETTVGHNLLGSAVWKHLSRLDLDRAALRHDGVVALSEAQ